MPLSYSLLVWEWFINNVVILEWKLGLCHGSTMSDVKVPLLIMEVTVLKFGRNTNWLEYEVSKNIIAA